MNSKGNPMRKYILLLLCSMYSKAILADLDTYLGHAISEGDKTSTVQLVKLMTTLGTPPTDKRINLIVKKLFGDVRGNYDKALAEVKLGGAAPEMPVKAEFKDIKTGKEAVTAMAKLFEDEKGSGYMALQAIAGTTGRTKEAGAAAKNIAATIKTSGAMIA